MDNKNADKDFLVNKIVVLQEMIVEKTSQFNEMVETIKRFEGHSSGSKDLSEKIGNHIKKQQADVAQLATQQKLAPDISKFVEMVLENVRTFVRQACGDVERLYFSKQGELLFLQQEIEKLIISKKKCEQNLKELETPQEPQEVNSSSEVAEQSLDAAAEKEQQPAKKKRVRPDQDPTTRAGRAAMDIAERKKKAKKAAQQA
jgi:hypothetical protein